MPSKPVAKNDKRRALGKEGEDAGAIWLESRGMRVLERNFRCRMGEIDIVGEIDGMTVIVEARGRSSDKWGTAAESIDYEKRRKLKMLAAYYMCLRGKADEAYRIDVLSMRYGEDGRPCQFQWFQNAI